MKQQVDLRFRRGEGEMHYIGVLVEDPIAVLNVANKHFGDPTKDIGGPSLPPKEKP